MGRDMELREPGEQPLPLEEEDVIARRKRREREPARRIGAGLEVAAVRGVDGGDQDLPGELSPVVAHPPPRRTRLLQPHFHVLRSGGDALPEA